MLAVGFTVVDTPLFFKCLFKYCGGMGRGGRGGGKQGETKVSGERMSIQEEHTTIACVRVVLRVWVRVMLKVRIRVTVRGKGKV